MAGITLAQAEAKLTTWLAAEDAVSEGQSFSKAGRSLTRAELPFIADRVAFWDAKVKELSSRTSGKIKVRGITPYSHR